MRVRRENLRDINMLKGLDIDSPINTRYNNHLGTGKTLFQPATEATFSVIENATKTKQIISIYNANKLCSKKGKIQTCDHKNCSELT